MSSRVPRIGFGSSPAGDVRRERHLRARMVLLIALSCAIDTGILVAFAWSGLCNAQPAVTYAAVSLLSWSLFYVLLNSGWSERGADPYLTLWQVACAAATELACAYAWPSISFYMLLLLFIVFAFGALRLGRGAILLTWLAVSALVGGVMLRPGSPLQLPIHTPLQQALSWAALMLVILRCTFVGLYGNAVRFKLTQRNQQLAEAYAQIEHLATFDTLTGTLNRRPLWLLLEERARRSLGAPQGFSVAMLDLDHFKSVNDTYGHLVGDQALRQFADVVRRCLHSSDTLGRYGGEEFILLLDHVSGESPSDRCQRIRRAVAETAWDRVAEGLKLTVSIGIASFDPRQSVEEVVRRADEALYAAKDQGRNRVVDRVSASSPPVPPSGPAPA